MFTKNQFNTILYISIMLFLDVLILIFSLELSISYNTNKLNNIEIDKYYWIFLIIILMLFFEKIYFLRYDFWSETKRILKALIYSFTSVFVVITLAKTSHEYSGTLIILFFVILAIALPLFKRLIKKLLFNFDIFKLYVKVVSNSSQKRILTDEIEKNWYLGYTVNDINYNIVLISSKNFKINKLQEEIRKYSKRTKDVFIIPYLYDIDFSFAEVVDYFNIRLSAIHLENRLLNKKNLFIKYFFEKLLVICLFPVILFIHIFISCIIKFDSKGPVIFKQKRLGRDGNLYSLYKYRTMYTSGKGLLEKYLKENPDEVEYYKLYHKYKNDPRITEVGKFLRRTSLDELPQFFNVLRGDMNLIGPRPYLKEEEDKIRNYESEIIFNIKPGITGLWQVSGRNELLFKERVNLDKWYIKNWSLWIDFIIFIKTLKVVALKTGAK